MQTVFITVFEMLFVFLTPYLPRFISAQVSSVRLRSNRRTFQNQHNRARAAKGRPNSLF